MAVQCMLRMDVLDVAPELEDFVSIEALQRGLEAYIDYYNNKRIKLGLGGMSPVEYRQQWSVV